GIRDLIVTGVQTCALPIWSDRLGALRQPSRSDRRGRRRPHHDRLQGRLPLSIEDPGLGPSGLHLRDADDALHRRRDRGGRAPPRGTPLADHHAERRKVVSRSLMLALGAVFAFPGLAAAQGPAAATGGWVGPFAVIAAGIGMALAAGLCGLGQGRAVAAAVDAMARQPAAAARIQTAMIIGLALIESLAIYVLVVAMILLFVQPIKG